MYRVRPLYCYVWEIKGKETEEKIKSTGLIFHEFFVRFAAADAGQYSETQESATHRNFIIRGEGEGFDDAADVELAFAAGGGLFAAARAEDAAELADVAFGGIAQERVGASFAANLFNAAEDFTLAGATKAVREFGVKRYIATNTTITEDQFGFVDSVIFVFSHGYSIK